MAFLPTLAVTEILCSFRLLLEGKADKDMPESPRLEFLESFQQTILLYQMQKAAFLGVE